MGFLQQCEGAFLLFLCLQMQMACLRLYSDSLLPAGDWRGGHAERERACCSRWPMARPPADRSQTCSLGALRCRRALPQRRASGARRGSSSRRLRRRRRRQRRRRRLRLTSLHMPRLTSIKVAKPSLCSPSEWCPVLAGPESACTGAVSAAWRCWLGQGVIKNSAVECSRAGDDHFNDGGGFEPMHYDDPGVDNGAVQNGDTPGQDGHGSDLGDGLPNTASSPNRSHRCSARQIVLPLPASPFCGCLISSSC